MLACALVILFMFLTHGRPPSPADLDRAIPPEAHGREEPWRAIVEAVPVLVVGGAISVIVAEVITALVRAAHRLEDATRDLTRRQTEAEVARSVQRGLLPAELPRIPGATLAARSDPAAEVGGDYYDAFTLADGRLVIVVADVAGKGTPAALVAAALQSAVRARVAVDDDLSRLLAGANARFITSSGEGRFATIFVAVIDPRDQVVRYASAGHNPALLLSDGRSETLKATGPPLGVDPDARFEQVEARPAPGSRLLVYSDGISEAMSDRRELLGVERLAEAAAAAREGNADDMVRSVFTAAERWRGAAEQSDDMTAIAVAIDSH
jgi:sigma-B regulation protein RsbU (phosphoserine phosphatase)